MTTVTAEMGRINFALIRSKNPDVGVTENIEDIDSLCLSNSEISEIDNLELFHHVKELDLKGNRLVSLDQLAFLTSLQILDVSNNLLDSDGLRRSMSQLPKSLLSINLSGNPCAKDLDAIGELQDAFPDLVIAIEEENFEDDVGENEVADQETSETEGGETELADSPGDDAESIPLNADDVLKMIVDRKCQLQQISPGLDLESTVVKLNDEMEKAIDFTNRRRAHKNADFHALTESIERRTADLVQRNQRNHDDTSSTFNIVLERIRNSANERMAEIHSRHVQELHKQDV